MTIAIRKSLPATPSGVGTTAGPPVLRDDQLATLSLVQAPIWVFDVSHHRMWWGNQSALRFWGAADVADLRARDFSSDSEMVRQRLQLIVRNTPPGQCASENWTLYPQDRPSTVSLSFRSVRLSPTGVGLLIEAHPMGLPAHDTDAMRILEAARNTPLLVTTASLDGYVLSANPAAYDRYGGYSKTGGENRRLSERFADPAIADEMLAAGRENRIFTADVEVATATGAGWHHLTARRGRDPLDGGTVIVVTEEDITDRVHHQAALTRWNDMLERRVKERTGELADKTRTLEAMMLEAEAARQAAEQATQAKSVFLASMSHELRTPLNAILGFSEMVRDAITGPLSDRYRSYGDDIHQAASQLLDLINDLLDLSRIEAGEMTLDEEVIRLDELAEQCLHQVCAATVARNIHVDCDIPDPLSRVRGDLRRIRQVLLNILTNAAKFTADGGSVRITATRIPEGLAIDISDTGIGIPDSEIDAVLRPYRSGKSVKGRRQEGTGLGLPIAKALMEIHGGGLTIDSAPGVGTTVRLTLPARRLLDPS